MAIAALALCLKLMPAAVYPVPDGTPSLLMPLLEPEGSLRALAVGILCFAVDVLLYLPFVRMGNRIRKDLKVKGESGENHLKTAIVLTLVSLFLIALAIPSYSWTRTNVSKIEKFYNSKLSPIIMIPEALDRELL